MMWRGMAFGGGSFDMRFLRSLGRDGFRRPDICGRLRFGRFNRGLEGWLESRRFNLRRTIIHEGRDEGFVLPGFLRFEMERLRGLAGRCRRTFGVAPPHDGGIEPFLDDRAGAGLDDGLLAQDRLAMRLLIEICLHPVRFFGTEQTCVGMCVGELQTLGAGDNVLERNAPLFGQTLDSLTGHSVLFYSSLCSLSSTIADRTASTIRNLAARSIADFNERNSLTFDAANLSRQWDSRWR